MSIDGMTSPNFSFSLSGSLQQNCVCTGLVSGTQTITADGMGNFSQTFNLGSYALTGVSLKAELFLSISSMAANQTLSLPNSAVLSFGSTSGVPEPKTISLMLVGIAGLGLMLYKRRA
jgi:hypothetical protein